mgnify:CR=1 FL=1
MKSSLPSHLPQRAFGTGANKKIPTRDAEERLEEQLCEISQGMCSTLTNCQRHPVVVKGAGQNNENEAQRKSTCQGDDFCQRAYCKGHGCVESSTSSIYSDRVVGLKKEWRTRWFVLVWTAEKQTPTLASPPRFCLRRRLFPLPPPSSSLPLPSQPQLPFALLCDPRASCCTQFFSRLLVQITASSISPVHVLLPPPAHPLKKW